MNHFSIAKALKMLVHDEGLRLVPYFCPAGHRTVGIGHNLEANPVSGEIAGRLQEVGSITRDQAFFLCGEQLERSTDDALAIFGDEFLQFSECRQLGIINMLYAMGRSRFEKFGNTIAAIKRADWEEAAQNVQDSLWGRKQAPNRARRVAALFKEGGRLEHGISEDLDRYCDTRL